MGFTGDFAGNPGAVHFYRVNVFEVYQEVGNRILGKEISRFQTGINSINEHKRNVVNKSPCFYGINVLQISMILFKRVLQKIKRLLCKKISAILTRIVSIFITFYRLFLTVLRKVRKLELKMTSRNSYMCIYC